MHFDEDKVSFNEGNVSYNDCSLSLFEFDISLVDAYLYSDNASTILVDAYPYSDDASPYLVDAFTSIIEASEGPLPTAELISISSESRDCPSELIFFAANYSKSTIRKIPRAERYVSALGKNERKCKKCIGRLKQAHPGHFGGLRQLHNFQDGWCQVGQFAGV